MAMEELKRVTETEQLIQSRKEAAMAECRHQLVAAQKEGQRILEESRQTAEASVKEMILQAEQAAQGTTKTRLDEAAKSCETLKQSAQTRLEQAATLIAERVVNS